MSNTAPSAPNQAWGSDITYLWTQQGWIYLAVIIDLYSRRVVGWSIDPKELKEKSAAFDRTLRIDVHPVDRKVVDPIVAENPTQLGQMPE